MSCTSSFPDISTNGQHAVGSRVLWPENTMYAFERAIDDLGYHYLELDVRLTADRVPVVFHDATLDRTTDGTGKVSDHTLAELQSLDAAYHFGPDGDFPLRGSGIRISPLEELFDFFEDEDDSELLRPP